MVHTATPWLSSGGLVCDQGGFMVADCAAQRRLHDERDANAALIVRAVNRDHCHDPMLEALKTFVEGANPSLCEWCETSVEHDSDGAWTEPLRHKIDCLYLKAVAAIALAQPKAEAS